MPFSQADADNLRAAIATGARRVRFEDGRETEYRSLPEMERALALVETAISSTAPGERFRSSVITFDRE